jgi:hypothetical protein
MITTYTKSIFRASIRNYSCLTGGMTANKCTIKAAVYWNVRECILVDDYQRFIGTCLLDYMFSNARNCHINIPCHEGLKPCLYLS